MAIVYRHRKKSNLEVFYIGIGKEVKRAYNQERSKRNNLWAKIVDKYDYIVEIIAEDIDWKDACELEVFLISIYGRIDLKTGTLCNMTSGGEGAVNLIRTDLHKKRISESRKGYRHSEETRQKLKEARKHYVTSEETKIKLSIAGRDRVVTEETRKKKSISMKGKQLGAKSNRAKIILDLQTGIFYLCIREAAEAFALDMDFLQRRLSGTCKNNTSLVYA